MPITNDVYDQLKIDRLKHFLEAQAEKGLPRPYEVFVDTLKVVPKTEDPKDFDNYEFYMNEDTEKVRILIYNSQLTPRNDQYIFQVQRTVGGAKSLNGLGDVENLMNEKLAARDREHEMNRLKERVDDLEGELEEQERYNKELEDVVRDLRANKFKMGNINLLEFASGLLETAARRNPQVLGKLIPGGEALAGMLGPGGAMPSAPPQPVSEVSMERETAPPISPEDMHKLQFINAIEQKLSAEQWQKFNGIMQALALQPELIADIFQLLENKQ